MGESVSIKEQTLGLCPKPYEPLKRFNPNFD